MKVACEKIQQLNKTLPSQYTYTEIIPSFFKQDIIVYSDFINKNFSEENKLILIEVLWKIVLSDGEVHDYESNLIRRLAGLLYISDVDSGNSKKRALMKLKDSNL